MSRIPARDHEGRDFKSLKVMADYWGVKYSTFIQRFNKGWSIKDCLSKPNAVRNVKFNGKTYDNVKVLCNSLQGVNYYTTQTMLRRGLALEEAIITQQQRYKQRKAKKALKLGLEK